ncbi:MAG: sigma-70 family RNA polymerase sigma factor [Proteobacteria bacterium]|nr:sigma-70 family RNA polymerase sigma factor [Pseudomonadota bacterium]
MSAPPPVTELLQRAAGGDAAARDALLAAVYPEMRRLARHLLAGDRMRQQIEPTELVHGAALKLIGQAQLSAHDRGHFLAYAGQVMRQVLIDHVRHERAAKRDAGTQVTLVSSLPDEPRGGGGVDLEALHEALERLAAASPELARLVERRYFAGLTLEQIAELDGRSSATVKRQWRAARAWLHDALGGAG